MSKESIGSSEIAAVLGLDPYRTPYDVWLVKTGREEKNLPTDATRRGNLLEPAVAEWFESEMGLLKNDIATNLIGKHRYGRWCVAIPDRAYIKQGKFSICEIKTTRMHVDPDDLQQNWFLQVNFQAAVISGCKDVFIDQLYIAWLDGSLNFGYQKFDYDPLFGNSLIDMADVWYEAHVIADIPPEPINGSDVKRMYRKSAQKTVHATDSVLEAYIKAKELKAAIKEAEAELEVLESGLMLAMQDAEELEYMGNTLVTWKSAKDVTRFDAKALQQNEPELYEEYLKVSPGSRVFRLK